MSSASHPSADQANGMPAAEAPADDTLAQLRSEREAFLAEKQAAEQALTVRKEELDRQTMMLMSRLREMHERERQLVSRTEEPAPAANGAAAAEIEDLRQQLREAQETAAQLRTERDSAVAQLEQLQSMYRELEQTNAAHETALEQMRQLHGEPTGEGTFPQAELALLRRQAEEAEALRRQVETLRSERDAALARAPQRGPAPVPEENEDSTPDGDASEARRQSLETQRKLVRDLREMHQRENSQRQKLEAQQRSLAEEQERIKRLEKELEDRERRVVLREAEIRLENAELRELKEIAEQEVAHERAQLNQERVRIARLREVLRMEQAAFHAAIERYSALEELPPGAAQ